MVTAIWIMFLVALAILLPLPALGDWGRQPGRRSRPPSVSQRLRRSTLTARIRTTEDANRIPSTAGRRAIRGRR
jgi:hypothetical protein